MAFNCYCEVCGNRTEDDRPICIACASEKIEELEGELAILEEKVKELILEYICEETDE